MGGGFGGVKAALELQQDDRFAVTLVSDSDYFRYYPALYHSATGGARQVSAIPLSEFFAEHATTFVHARATRIDRQTKKVHTKGGGVLPYDSLIVGLGMTTNYFGIKGLEEYAYGIKSIEEAEEFKHHLHQQLIDNKKPDAHYLIIGGGPTGVELAGALPGYLKHILEQHGVHRRAVRVVLIEAAPRILPRSPKAVSRATTRQLRRLGVKVHVNQKVEAETADALIVNGQPITSHTVVWTAGVTCSPFLADNHFTLTPRHKVQVDQYLRAEDAIYVIGDNADTPYSGVAQTALHDAKFVARNLKRQLDGRALVAYRPASPIYVTPAGPHWASVVWGKLVFWGWLGWVLRSLADLVAYHDYQPVWPAAQRWLAGNLEEDDCPVCE